MANKDNQKLNHADPTYRFMSRQNDNGKVIYSAPIERPEDETVETPVEDEADRTFTTLRYPDGRRIRVHFFDTEDREVAMMQKRRMDALHRQAQRYDKKYTLLKKYGTNEDVDNVWDFFPGMRRNEDGYTLADYSDLPGLIADFIRQFHPKSRLYPQVYLLHTQGYTSLEISELLEKPQDMICTITTESLRIAQEYRRLYFDEGCYKFPEPFQSKRRRR